jgi:hypothetical protein
MKVFAITQCLLLGLISFSFAQEEGQSKVPLLPPIVGPAPNAAAMAKYGDIPVSYYTGTPDISVPLYTVQEGSLTVPISVSYHASGIRVSEQASWVGLGWSLQSGGMISRVMRGRQDEGQRGYLTDGYKVDDYSYSSSGQYLGEVAKGYTDAESDVYFISLPGLSAKFYFNYQGEILFQDYQDLLVESPFITHQDLWRVVTPDGTQYYFGEKDSAGATELTSAWKENGGTSTSYISAWHLQKIVSADLQDEIVFYYSEGEDIETQAMPSEQLVLPIIDPHDANSIMCWMTRAYNKDLTPQFSRTSQHLPTRITFTNGSVEFTPSVTERQDIPGTHSLARVTIKNKQNEVLKYFGFEYGNFESENNKRLKLEHVVEFSAEGRALPPHTFEYNEQYQLPDYLSYQQDHWGFYNNNTTDKLIPQIVERLDGSFYYYDEGGNRDTDPDRTKANILTGVKYPTGGKTVFEYEAHEISMVGSRQAKEYYIDPVGARCPPKSTGPTDCPEPSYFTLDKQTMAHITISCLCFGDLEKTPAAASLTTPPNGSWSAGCGGTNPKGEYDEYVLLGPGRYTVEAFADNLNATYHASARINIDLYKVRDVTVASAPKYVGGVRIKRIANYDAAGKLVKSQHFKYQYLNDEQWFSSGALIRKPRYWYRNTVGVKSEGVGGGIATMCDRENIFSSALNSLGDGTHIGYKQVYVYEGDAESNGWRLLKYSSSEDEPDTGINDFPFPPPESRDNRRGRLLEDWMVDASGNPVQITENLYERSLEHYRLTKNLKPGKFVAIANNEIFQDDNAEGRTYKVGMYTDQQEWMYLKKSTVKTYQGSDFLERSTVFNYERPSHHVQLTSTESTGSDGVVTRKLFKYPADYAYGYDSNTAGHQALVANHIVNAVVEEQTLVDNKFMGSKIVQYHPDLFKPMSIWMLEAPTPLLSLNKEDQVDGRFKYLLSNDQYFSLKANLTYVGGKLIQINTPAATTSYRWDSRKFPVSETVNANYADVFYTGFEDGDGDSADDDSRTGRKSKTDFNLSLSGLSGGKYSLTYWKKENGTWCFKSSQIDVTGSSYATTLSGQVDDVRFSPQNAMMTTLTYDALVGQTSKSSPASDIAFFDYDDFQRLLNIRDKDRNIVKNYVYRYSMPASSSSPTSPTPNLDPQWTDTGNKRCLMGNAGPTGYEEKEQHDLNPLSTTFNQFRWIDNGWDPSDCQLCIAPSRKWINGQCESGAYTVVDMYQLNGKCITEYQYLFSDGSASIVYKQTSIYPCQF